MELWKRRQAIIVWEWDLQNADYDEEPRPEFETSVKTFRINPVTREKEPYMPLWSRTWRYMVTGSLVFFMVTIFIIYNPITNQQANNILIFFLLIVDLCCSCCCTWNNNL